MFKKNDREKENMIATQLKLDSTLAEEQSEVNNAGKSTRLDESRLKKPDVDAPLKAIPKAEKVVLKSRKAENLPFDVENELRLDDSKDTQKKNWKLSDFHNERRLGYGR